MKKIVCIITIFLLLGSFLPANPVKEAAGAVAEVATTAAGAVADFAVDKYYDFIDNMYEVETIIKAGISTDALSSNKLDFVVDEDFYIQLEIYARETKFYSIPNKDIDFQVVFPQTEILAVELAEVAGDRLTAEIVDPVTGNHIYGFKMNTTDTDRRRIPMKVIFRCRPLAAGNYRISVIYDRNIQPKYDQYRNYKYTME